MKTWHWLVIAFALILLYFWNRKTAEKKRVDYNAGQAAAAAAAGEAMAAASAAANKFSSDVYGQWGGVDYHVQDLTPADQSVYPGWYHTGDGGWWNKDTGDWYSPGSAPAALKPMSAEALAKQYEVGSIILTNDQENAARLASALPQTYVIF